VRSSSLNDHLARTETTLPPARGHNLYGVLVGFRVAERTRRRKRFDGAFVDLGEECCVEPVDGVTQTNSEANLDDLLLAEMRK
jgi:hypothetical protein